MGVTQAQWAKWNEKHCSLREGLFMNPEREPAVIKWIACCWCQELAAEMTLVLSDDVIAEGHMTVRIWFILSNDSLSTVRSSSMIEWGWCHDSLLPLSASVCWTGKVLKLGPSRLPSGWCKISNGGSFLFSQSKQWVGPNGVLEQAEERSCDFHARYTPVYCITYSWKSPQCSGTAFGWHWGLQTTWGWKIHLMNGASSHASQLLIQYLFFVCLVLGSNEWVLYGLE